MDVFHHDCYDITLGPLDRLHPFDGRKYSKVQRALRALGIETRPVSGPVPDAALDAFAGEILRPLQASKRYILRALELPYIPLLPFGLVDRRILRPMRWAVQGTIQAAEVALRGHDAWNLSGGYHHASRNAAEGFCIYNDVGIAVQDLCHRGLLGDEDRILVVDVDAHHGNGNASVFLKDARVQILDIYNADLYPRSPTTRRRVDIGLPLPSGTSGADYIARLRTGLERLAGGARLAFVVAGTDVLASDPLGRLGLDVMHCAERDRLVLEHLRRLGVPAVFLAGGGYGRQSAEAMVAGIAACRDLA